MINFLKTFRKDEDGAVTVDWVVLTAAVVGLAVAAFGAISSSTENLTTGIGAAMTSGADGVDFDNVTAGTN